MLSDTMAMFNLSKDFNNVGFHETEQHKSLIKEVKTSIKLGKMIAISGIVGSGKTSTLQQLQNTLIQEKEILVSNSFSIEKAKLNLVTLMTALFYDLASDKEKFPSQPERRERRLRELIVKKQKPVALIIDEAHDLHSRTLIGLKRLMEMVRQTGGGSLAIVLAGHPKLRNSLRSSAMEEIGARTEIFEIECFKSVEEKCKYIEWLVNSSTKPKTKIKDVIQDDAIKLLAELLSTPLQIEQHLRLAFERAHKVGQVPLTTEIIERVVSKDIDDLEPKLIRLGYNPRALAEILNVRPAEVKQFLRGKLSTARNNELQSNLRYAGIPI